MINSIIIKALHSPKNTLKKGKEERKKRVSIFATYVGFETAKGG